MCGIKDLLLSTDKHMDGLKLIEQLDYFTDAQYYTYRDRTYRKWTV